MGLHDEPCARNRCGALHQERHGGFVRAEAARADHHVRVPIDLTAKQHQQRSIGAEQAAPDLLRLLQALRDHGGFGRHVFTEERLRASVVSNHRIPAAACEIDGVRRQLALVDENRTRYPPDLTRQQQLPHRLSGGGDGAVRQVAAVPHEHRSGGEAAEERERHLVPDPGNVGCPLVAANDVDRVRVGVPEDVGTFEYRTFEEAHVFE